MVKLWRCRICGDPYIGAAPPDNCPFCGAHRRFIKPAARSLEISFNVNLTRTDKANAQRALNVELSNSAFYSCAAKKTDSREGKLLFKALGKVEMEHASIWKKILGLAAADKVAAVCYTSTKANLKESHDREQKAIAFYRTAAHESSTARLREIFLALVEIETDHLDLSEARL